MPSTSLLLVEEDAASQDLIAGVLTGLGYTVTVVSGGPEAVAQAANHQLVIIDIVTGGATPADICRQIRATPDLPPIPVMCISQSDDVEDRIRFLEAGADDVMAKPFDARELDARVEALLLRFQRSHEVAPTLTITRSPLALRHSVALFSPKGGVGTTTIAVNVAVVMAERRPDRTLLIDLDRQFGQVATHLNLTVRQTLADIVRDDAALREPELLRAYATRHPTGLHVLPAPGTPELAELVSADHVERLLRTATQAYDTVLIDAGSHLDEPVLAALEGAEGALLPVQPEIAALKALRLLLDFFGEVGSVAAKSSLVLNNMFAKDILKMRDIESALGTQVAATLPYDPFLYLKAINEGIPVVRGAPRSAPAEKFIEMAAIAFGEDDIYPIGAGEERRGRRLGLLRRR